VTTYKTDQNSAKKPYDDSPRLVVYGDVREITQHSQQSARSTDSNSFGNNFLTA
jgi:hypothetical protein